MPTRNQIKLVKSLNRKKERQISGLFVAEGRKVVAEALSAGLVVEHLFCLKELLQEDLFREAEGIDPATMDRMSLLSSGSDALAVLHIPTPKTLSLEQHWIVLDSIRDPGNLGTIIRIADWFSWDVLCSNDCVDLYNPKTVQASMGSIYRVNIEYDSLLERMNASTNRVFLGSDMNGTSIWETDRSKSALGLIIGSESHGMSGEVRSLCSEIITIPGGGAESLNAAVACGIMVSTLSRPV